MASTISMKTVKASTTKHKDKPRPGNKSIQIDPYICFYETEEDDKTKEVEEAKILVIHDSSLSAYKKNLLKRKFPYINKFDHDGLSGVGAMYDLTIRVL